MERIKDSNSTSSSTANVQTQNFSIQVGEDKSSSLHSKIPIKVQEPSNQIKPRKVAGQFLEKFFRVFFFVHLTLIAILAIVLTIRGLLSGHRHHFHPNKWYPPLLTATATAGIVSFSWQWITLNNPALALKIAFRFSPLLTCAVGILLVLIGSPASLAIGVIVLIFTIIQSLYTCWVSPRFDYAIKLLSASTAFPPAKTTSLVLLSIITSIGYSCFVVSGIGGATAIATEIDIFFILVILLSLAWSMQVIKYTLQVTIGRLKYINFAYGAEMETNVALRDTIEHLMGRVCAGSVIVPILTIIRGSARAISLIVGGTDEFLFSCANCYSAVASTLVRYGNRWGFVQIGVYSKGLVQASADTWDMFQRVGMEPLIDSDLTGSFCFLCGVAAGAICTLAAGSWTLVVHKSYATEVSVYAFLIGYFMCRIAMAWPQSCVSSYYVAYAENPQNPRFDSSIPDRLQELQRYGA